MIKELYIPNVRSKSGEESRYHTSRRPHRNMTMRGIRRELQRRASSACHGRDLRANVRARLYWLKRRGHSAGCEVQGRIRVR